MSAKRFPGGPALVVEVRIDVVHVSHVHQQPGPVVKALSGVGQRREPRRRVGVLTHASFEGSAQSVRRLSSWVELVELVELRRSTVVAAPGGGPTCSSKNLHGF